MYLLFYYDPVIINSSVSRLAVSPWIAICNADAIYLVTCQLNAVFAVLHFFITELVTVGFYGLIVNS